MGCFASSTADAGGAPRPGPQILTQDLQDSRSVCIAQIRTCLKEIAPEGEVDIGPDAKWGKFNSQELFRQSSQVIFVFDWDDTICPSYWINTSPDLLWSKKAPPDADIQANLKNITEEAIKLLLHAKRLGHVIFVTNARRPWVATSLQNFLPDMHGTMEDIPVFYAQDNIKKLQDEGFDADADCILTAIKAEAMKEAVKSFYGRYPNQSWKNIISIGDGLFEHDAIREVAELRPHKDDSVKPCRVKTIKMMDNPSPEELHSEIALIRAWLAGITSFDGNVNVDLDSSEARVKDWNKQFSVPLDLEPIVLTDVDNSKK